VAMVMMLFPVSGDGPRLEPAALEALARMGVTSVALLRDSSVTGLVLEGWTFDPLDAPRAAQALNGTPRAHPDTPAARAFGHTDVCCAAVENGEQIATGRS
jgi:hypothetical protein